VTENRMLRRIFKSMREEVRGQGSGFSNSLAENKNCDEQCNSINCKSPEFRKYFELNEKML
jgi:hypothetical protein